MFEPAAKISVERLIGNGSFHVHKDDTALFTFTRVQGDDRNVEHYFETSDATLYFVRGTGKIAINDRVVEYGGKWFEIPRETEYQIFPETDTLMLTIQKPTKDAIDTTACAGERMPSRN
jgi:mannose-6-phosphate isomerase-like protein (cupin superfamily)